MFAAQSFIPGSSHVVFQLLFLHAIFLLFRDIAHFQQLSGLVVTDSRTQLDLTTVPGLRRTLFTTEAIWDKADNLQFLLIPGHSFERAALPDALLYRRK